MINQAAAQRLHEQQQMYSHSRGPSLQSLTFDHSQVHDHLLVIEDPIDIHPAAVQTAVCAPHI